MRSWSMMQCTNTSRCSRKVFNPLTWSEPKTDPLLPKMPGKHVHFADEHAGYTVSGTTPSPLRSILSLPSSTGPITPPAFAIALPHPPAHSGHKHPHKSRPTIHPLLAVTKPRTNFDVSQHHSHISTSYTILSSRSSLLSEPAISPPLLRMTITLPHLPWLIQVELNVNTDSEGRERFQRPLHTPHPSLPLYPTSYSREFNETA